MPSYADSGVDYTKIAGFKKIMRDVGRKTRNFPQKRGVYLSETITHAHGAIYEYRGITPHLSVQTQEGLGNKNWIAEWMYRYKADGKTYYRGIGIDTALMAVNDCIAHGALPVIFTDEIVAGESEWYTDLDRARDLALGFEEVCRVVGMALPQGESSSLRYIVNPRGDLLSVPALSGCVTGIVAPMRNLITRDRIEAGDAIIGVASSGLHANGVSLVIEVAETLKHHFLTKLPRTETTLGEEALTPTRSYVRLVEALLENNVRIHGIIPGTGGGVSKLAVHQVPFTYVIEYSMRVPRIFLFIRSCGVTLEDCLSTFNWGIGYYLLVPKDEINRTLIIGTAANYNLSLIGFVEDGERQVVYEPAGIILKHPEVAEQKQLPHEKNVGKDELFGYGTNIPPLPPSKTQKTFE